MPVRRRNDKRREVLDDDAVSWLQGDDRSWFQFASVDEKRDLWMRHGDQTKFEWREGWSTPSRL